MLYHTTLYRTAIRISFISKKWSHLSFCLSFKKNSRVSVVSLLHFHREMSQARYFFGLNGIHPNPVPTRGGCSKLNQIQRSMPCHIFYWLISGIICIRLLFVRYGTNNKNQAIKFQMAPVLHTFSSVSNRDFLTLPTVTNFKLQPECQ